MFESSAGTREVLTLMLTIAVGYMNSQETQFSAESYNMECNEDPLMSVGLLQ